MQTANRNEDVRFSNTEWRFLGEYPLNEFMEEMGNQDMANTSLLFQTLRNLGIHPELISNIESTLMRSIEEGGAQLNNGRYHALAFIRLYCQKKTMEDFNSVKSPGQYNAEQAMERSHIIHPSDVGVNGGWGCFLIKKGSNESREAPPSSRYFVDLYLYREG